MKDVLIITSRSEKTVSWNVREVYVRQFCEAVNARSPSIRARFTTYQDLHHTIRGGKTVVFDTLNKIDLSQVQFVHFKNWHFERGQAPVVAAYLKAYGIPYVNSEVTAVSVAPGKLAQMFLLGSQGVPVPDTFYAAKQALLRIFTRGKLPESFSYPLIMKANDGAQGHDNHLIREAKEAIDVLTASEPDKEYVLQNFIPNDGDYRILFMGLPGEPLVFHRRAAAGNHLNNTSQGGSGQFIDTDSLPPEYLDYARKAAELTGREIGGVDILADKETGKPYVLEVNGTPALATGYGTDVKIEYFARYIEQALQIKGEKDG